MHELLSVNYSLYSTRDWISFNSCNQGPDLLFYLRVLRNGLAAAARHHRFSDTRTSQTPAVGPVGDNGDDPEARK
jgi:hypothetical protein